MIVPQLEDLVPYPGFTEELLHDNTPACPFFRSQGSFAYCRKGVPKHFVLNPADPYTQSLRVDHASMQLYCFDRYGKCAFYNGSLKAPGELLVQVTINGE